MILITGGLGPGSAPGSLIGGGLAIGEGDVPETPTSVIPGRGRPDPRYCVLSRPFEQAADEDVTYPLTIANRLGPVTTYTAGNPLRAEIWAGDDTTPLATPAVAWVDPATGAAGVTVLRSHLASSGLAPGVYRIVGIVREPGPIDRRFLDEPFRLLAAPGTAAARRAYATYDQMLRAFPALGSIRGPEGTQSNWAEQLADASDELDDFLVDRARPSRRAEVRALLDDGRLVESARVRRIVANLALANVLGAQLPTDAMVQAGRSSGYQSLGRDFAAKAQAEMQKLVAEVDDSAAGDGSSTITVDCTEAAFAMSDPTRRLTAGRIRLGSRYRYDPEC